METKGRKLFHDFINRIRKSENKELRQKTYCAQYFMRKIDDTYEALNTDRLMTLYDDEIEIRFIHDTILHSMIYTIIFFIYSLCEIIDDDFKNNPIRKIRNRIGHGKTFGVHFAPLNSFTKSPDEVFSNFEFNDLMRCQFKRGEQFVNIISLVWAFRNFDGKMFSKVDNTEIESPISAHEYLTKKLAEETLFIDSSGNFACNIDKLYISTCEKLESYLNSNYRF